MDRTLLWLDEAVHVDSVLITEHDRSPRHLYRVVGGTDEGRTFDTLRELATYIAQLPTALKRQAPDFS
jgi:hypothetical protein